MKDLTLSGFERIGIFAGWGITPSSHLDLAESLHFNDIIVGIPATKNRREWHSMKAWGRLARRLEKLAAEINARGMTPHFMIWTARRRAFLERALVDLKDVVMSTGARSGLLDCEGDYHGRNTSVDISPSDASDLAREILSDDIILGVSGLDRIHSSLVPIARDLADYVVPQCYSFYKKPFNKAHWSHTTHTFPGYQQRRGFDSWDKEVDLRSTELSGGFSSPEVKTIMGLACYDCSRPANRGVPALTAQQTMRLAAAETHSLLNDLDQSAVKQVWYWSLATLRLRKNRGSLDYFGGVS